MIAAPKRQSARQVIERAQWDEAYEFVTLETCVPCDRRICGVLWFPEVR
jgi:hypothetical protein